MNYDTRHKTAVLVTEGVVTADDGRTLTTTTFEPDGPISSVVLLVGAMATRSRFYAPFAERLASHGARVVTFELRGMESVESAKAETGDLDRWIADAGNVLDHVAADANGLPLTWIGHSFGGQALPFVDHSKVGAAILITAGVGSVRFNAPGVKWRAPFLWKVIAPLTIRRYGYFAGNRIGLLGDLPPNVMRQWAKWCLHDDYLVADHPDHAEWFGAVTTPITSISFTDDEILSGKAMRTLADWYTGTHVTWARYSPRQLDLKRVGHHGFFRPEHVELWDELVVPHIAR